MKKEINLDDFKSVNIEEIKHLYSVSKSAEVLSLRTMKILSQHKKNGYMTVGLNVNKKSLVRGVHRLVALTYLENPNNYKKVNHIDGNKVNNHLDNLEWMTQTQNAQHAYKTGLTKTHPRKVVKIDLNDNKLETFESVKEAAKSIQLTRHSIIRACKGKMKTAGGFKWKYKVPDKVIDTSKMKRFNNYPYLVGKDGNIYSCGSKKMLKPITNSSGYQYVTLCKKGHKKKNLYVHQIVAQVFIPNPRDKPFVNHKNKNTKDNRVLNLEWVTTSENMLHAYNYSTNSL